MKFGLFVFIGLIALTSARFRKSAVPAIDEFDVASNSTGNITYKIIMPKIHLKPGQPIGPIFPSIIPFYPNGTEADEFVVAKHSNVTYKVILPQIHLKFGQPIGPIFPIFEPITNATSDEFLEVPTSSILESNGTDHQFNIPPITVSPQGPFGLMVPTFEPENDNSDIEDNEFVGCTMHVPTIHLKPGQPIGPIVPTCVPDN